jgi:hypothetical protein
LAIVDAFRTYDVVAVGEGAHGNEQGHAFRLSLIRDPRFAAAANDIVVEFGNAFYQTVADRFVRGEDVPHSALRQIWENTTQAHRVWDKPIYETLLREVRSVNASLPERRKLRVLLGDPPVDWNQVHKADDINVWARQRDLYPASLIRREVIAKGRRALVVYGDGHFFRRSPMPSIVKLLEAAPPVKVFAIATVTDPDLDAKQPGIAAWKQPSLTMLQGSVLGATPLSFFYPLRGDDWNAIRMEDAFDALLYLGPPSSITRSVPSPALCADTQYVQMRLSRMAIFPVIAQELARFKRDCQIP